MLFTQVFRIFATALKTVHLHSSTGHKNNPLGEHVQNLNQSRKICSALIG